MPNPFSQDATQRELDKLSNLPPEQGGIGIVVQGADVGVQGAVAKDLGKPGGWTLAASGQWFKQQGYAAAAWLGWRGK